MARPNNMTEEKLSTILSLIAEGKSLREACRTVGQSYGTVQDYMRADEARFAAYRAAQKTGTHALADECLEIADEEPERDGATGKVDPGYVAHRRLRIDTRLRLIGKWNQHDYGDKVTHAGDPDNPIKTETSLDASALSTEALRELMALRDAAKRN